ncbi:MAG: ParB/RepB/Spo0J family partition protein [Alphaproteobacteria bacterium]|nr:ParB/RepB/Spo0J family partition protein [Alphaproteobacteria bacterium]
MTTESAHTPKEDNTAAPKRRGLGRGLSALFDDDESDDTAAGGAGKAERRMLGVDEIIPGPFQPRHRDGIDEAALAELAASIRAHGILQPLLVREKPRMPGVYELIAGERRWRAAQKAQLHEVPVIVKPLSDQDAMEIGLIENLQREDLNALEEATAYRRLMNEFGHTQEKLAVAVGKSRSHVANMLRLLTLPHEVLELMDEGRLSAGHARALVGIEPAEAKTIARQVADRGLSVRTVEKMTTAHKEKTARPSSGPRPERPVKDVDTLALEQDLSEMLGMAVTIDPQGKGRGTLTVAYENLSQLDMVLLRLSIGN